MALTRKRRVFIEEYLRCWNGAEAARCAGYKFPRRQAFRLLTNVDIKEEIKRRIDELAMQADEVLLRLAEQARGLNKDFFTIDGHIDALAILSADKTHLIKKTKQTKYGLEIELYDAQVALEKIGRAHGLFVERHERSGEVTLRIVREDRAKSQAEDSSSWARKDSEVASKAQSGTRGPTRG